MKNKVNLRDQKIKNKRPKRDIYKQPTSASVGKDTVLSEVESTTDDNFTFVDLLEEYGWKKLIACPKFKKHMASLLGAVLNRKLDVRRFNFEDDVPCEISSVKEFIFDSYCTYKEKGIDHDTADPNKDIYFLVETQRYNQVNYKKMLLKYHNSLIDKLGDKFVNLNFNFPEIYTICFIDFMMDPDDPEYIHHSGFDDVSVHFSNLYNIIIIELPKFNKTEDQLETLLDKWLFLLKNMQQLDHVPEALNNDVFKTIFEKARIANFTNHQKAIYEMTIRKSSLMEGIIQNHKNEGIAAAIAESILETETSEEAEVKSTRVLDFLQHSNYSHNVIAELLGVPLDLVDKINEAIRHSA